MPATPQRFDISAEDVQSANRRSDGGGIYSAIEVPGDYEAILVDVSDYDKTKEGKSKGWVFHFQVMGCSFDEWVSFGTNARWKLIQIMEAFDYPVEQGVVAFDPNVYINSVVGAFVDWEQDPESLPEGASNYREIKYVYSLNDVEADETTEDEQVEEPEVL